jgi:WhiB family redox-sensing transcriptional regulator
MTKHRQRPIDLLNKARDTVDSVPCEDVPVIFFPEDLPAGGIRKQAIQMAKRLCATCPIQMACFEYALTAKERFGIWGGTLPSDR